jgi:hypothetical protein
MKSGRSGFYRRRDGEERLWLSPIDIENTMEDALRTSEVFPTDENYPTVDIERFIQRLGVRMDQYAELDDSVLGQTEFYVDGAPKILINRDLTGAIDNDETPQGTRGRWRATIAHEGGHVILHRVLFEVNRDQGGLFNLEVQSKSHRLMRCLKKNVLFRGSASDWREIQANMAMAELLMPLSLFRRVANKVMDQCGLKANALTNGSAAGTTLSRRMAALFDVSRQAAGIRLETLGIVSPAGQPWLI